MRRPVALFAVMVMAVLALEAQAPRRPPVPAAAAAPFSVVEATIPDMRKAMEERRVTSRELVQQYLTRIAFYEDRLNAVITVNRDALKEADERDRERAQGKVRGPLHGIPIALKDNIHTTDMPTTGGALAFDGLVPPYEATITKNLREAGAIIIAKTQMTELANWVAGGPMPMPGNYNALSGFGMNPYDPRRDPREATADGRPVLRHGRIELRHRHGGELLGSQRRHRNVGIDPQPGEPEHAGGDQADGWTYQPLRRHPDHGRPGHGRPDGAHGDRRRDPARRPGERITGPERRGDQDLPVATEPRLHGVPRRRTRSRARASAFRARSTTTRRHAARRQGAARRLESRAGQTDGRGDRRCSRRRAP